MKLTSLFFWCETTKIIIGWAMVVVWWSALSPTAPKIQVRIPLAIKMFVVVRKTKTYEKEAGIGPLKIYYWFSGGTKIIWKGLPSDVSQFSHSRHRIKFVTFAIIRRATV